MPLQTIPWHKLEPAFLESWGYPNEKFQAEHIAIEGPTGSGKSQFQIYIAQARVKLRAAHAMIIVTKPADDTIQSLGWPIIRKWPPEYGKHDHFVLWPPSPRDEKAAIDIQTSTIRQALTDIWHPKSNIIVLFDEIAYLEDELKMKLLIRRYWRESRALGISMVATTQRPAYVSRYMWSEPSWIVAFAPSDEEEAARVGQILGGRKLYTQELMNLERYQFIIINRRDKIAYKSKLGT